MIHNLLSIFGIFISENGQDAKQMLIWKRYYFNFLDERGFIETCRCIEMKKETISTEKQDLINTKYLTGFNFISLES